MNRISLVGLKNDLGLALAICLLYGVSSLADFFLSLGPPAYIPSVVLIFLSLWFNAKAFILLNTGIATGLILLGHFFTRPAGSQPQDLLDGTRFSLILLVWVSTAIVWLHKRREDRDRGIREELETQVFKYTANLHESRARLSAVIEMVPDAVIVVGADQRIFLFNQGATKTFGCSQEKALGRPFELLFPQRLRAIYRQHLTLFTAAEEATQYMWKGQEVCCLRENGEEFLAEASISKSIEENSLIFTIVLRDLTEYKKTEEVIRLIRGGTAAEIGEEFFKSLVKHLAAALYVRWAFVCESVDLEEARLQLIAFWAGTGFGENFSYNSRGTPCETVKRKGIAFYPKDVQKLFPGDPWLKEIGVESYVAIPLRDSKGKSLGHLGVMHDQPIEDNLLVKSILKIFAVRASAELERIQTEKRFRKLNEELEQRVLARTAKLEESRHALSTLIGNLPGLVYECRNDDDLNIAFVSEGCLDLTGYPAADLIQNRVSYWQQIIHSEDRDFVRARVHEAIKTNDSFQVTFRMITGGGQTKWVWKQGKGVYDADGNLQTVEGYIVDITEHQLREKQLMASLAEKEVLLKETQHRIKNNLQIISSLLALQSEAIKSKKAARLLLESQNRIHSLALLHEELYKGKSQTDVDLSLYIPNLIDHLAHSFKITPEQIQLRVQAAPVRVKSGVAIPCGLIINELVSNSLKYAFPHKREGSISVSLDLKSSGSLELAVQDNGIGFPSTLNWRDPTTVGLQIVNALVEQLSGTIRLDTKSGTIFTITFPAKNPQK